MLSGIGGSWTPHAAARVPGHQRGRRAGCDAIGSVLPAGRVWAQAKAATETAAAAATSSPESLVKVLYDTLSPKQRESICFPWDHTDPERGLLRTRVSNNWHITDYSSTTATSTPRTSRP